MSASPGPFAFDEFHRSELPRRMEDGRGAEAARSYNDVLHQRPDGQIEHLSEVARRRDER